MQLTDTDLENAMLEELDLDVTVDWRPYRCFRIDGCAHLGDVYGNCLWVCPRGEDPKPSNLIPFFGEPVRYSILIRKDNYSNSMWDCQEVRFEITCTIFRNEKPFYSFKCDDAAYAFSEANLLITHTVKNHPIDFNRYDYVTKEIIGRHIWYRNKPYTFCTYYEDRCCARAIPGHLDIVAETKSDHIPGEVTIDLLYPYDVRWFCMDY